MKKILSILLTFLLVFTLSPVESAGDSVVDPYVIFSSLEDYLNAYLTAKEGGSIEEFLLGGYRIEKINLTDFETLHLPTKILENFVIRRIEVDEFGIIFWFLPEYVENLNVNFWSDYPHFRLSIRESRSENQIENFLQQSVLIDGKYLYEGTLNFSAWFIWFSDDLRFYLYINLRQQDTEEFKTLIGSEHPRTFVRFAETRTVDLMDEDEVRNLIKYGERFLRGDVNGDVRVTTTDALEILRFIAGLQNVIVGDERALAAADVNGDGKIDTADAMEILRIVAGLA